MKNKNNNLWVMFLSLGTMFFMFSITIDVTWLKLLIISISLLHYIIAIIFAAKDYGNKKQNNKPYMQSFPPPPPPPTLNFKHQTINFSKMKHLERALDGQNQIWKYIVMFLVAFLGGQMIGSIPLVTVTFIKMITSGTVGAKPESIMDFSAYGISDNVGFALLIFAFVATFFTFALLIKPFHKRTVIETINGRNYIRKNRIWMGMLVWGIITIVGLIISLLTAQEGDIEVRFNIAKLIPLLLIVLILLPFQTTIEEIFFRGYLTQGVAARTKNRWIALIVVSLLFGFMHIANPEVKEFGFWLSMPQYILMGLLLGLVSILDDGIEIAIGIHFINNAFGALLTTHSSSIFKTDAIFKFNKVDPKFDLISISIATIIAFVVFAKIYKWDFSILNKKVEIAPPPTPTQLYAENPTVE
ncbi:MAG: type II CAAX endopeptidase family protein [Bacteroidia bacterium]|nr:type II CAAX endopeptidase family protein [Bacteroidia bacterium]